MLSRKPYIVRSLEAPFGRASDHFPVLLVTGARQVGKTTFLQELAGRDRAYVTLDDPRVRRLAVDDPALFMQRFRPPILIDEIQYAPGLLPYMKMDVDGSGRPGDWWLTGSQQFHLMKGVSETLAGRIGILHLLGLSRIEAAGQGALSEPFVPTGRRPGTGEGKPPRILSPELFRRIWRGSFPALVADDEAPVELFYRSYVQTYLQRDVRDLAQVGDELAFLRFLRAAAARTGQLLNHSDLARDADVAPNTARRWLSILEASGVVYLLPPYHANRTKRLVKTPKLYFLDTGLAAWLTDWTSPETLEAGAAAGAMFETWVVAEILKSWLHAGLRPPLHFFRDRDMAEVDLLIVADGIAHPVEIKKSASPERSMAKAFGRLARLDVPIGPGAVVCLADEALPLAEEVWAIPVGML
jgi:hypothetical protein